MKPYNYYRQYFKACKKHNQEKAIPLKGYELFMCEQEIDYLDNLDSLSLNIQMPFPKLMLEVCMNGAPTIIFAEQTPNGSVVLRYVGKNNTLDWYATPFKFIISPRDKEIIITGEFASRSESFRKFIDQAASHISAFFIQFLNVINCSNVEYSQTIKTSLPTKASFTTTVYRTLTLKQTKNNDQGGTHQGRSPREHVRRGHIRRYKDHQIWISSMLINPGVQGKIKKSYKV